MKKILVFLSLFSLSLSGVSAGDLRVEKAYESFITKLESRYSSEQIHSILIWVRSRATDLRWSSSLSSVKKVLFQDLIELNNEELYNYWLEKELDIDGIEQSEQAAIIKLKREIGTQELSTAAEKLINSSKIQYLALSDEREFVEWNTIYRLDYSQYFPVKSSSYSALKDLSGVLVKDVSWEERLIESYEYQEKLPYSKLSTLYGGLLTESHKTREQNGVYMWYNFNTFRFFNDEYWVYQSQLDTSWFDVNTTLLYRNDEGKYNFVTQYDSHPIVSTTSLYGIAEKHLMLDYLREDTKFPTSDIESVLWDMKTVVRKLRSESNSQWEYVANIYNWILDNISYSELINLSDEKIFSAIETFKNKDGVCTGYTKLMSYMLYLWWVYDAEVVRGHVIDAQDFPQIGHAWIRLWDRYYDPTFDDPVGAQNTKTSDQYKYFGLPKDIFYANRFDYGDLPNGFETASEEEIQSYIFNYLSDLSSKYQWQTDNYAVFAPVIFRNTHNLAYNTLITPELLASKIWSYTVANNSFRFTKEGKTQSIINFRYYSLTSENTERVLGILNYNTDDLYLFNWELENGQTQWRLAYDVSLR